MGLSGLCHVIIHSHFGPVSEAHHISDAAGSRPAVPAVTDSMFIAWEAHFVETKMGAFCDPDGDGAAELRPRFTKMNHSQAATSRVRYSRKLVNAGITGIRHGQDSARGDQPLSAIAADAALGSLGLAVAGACLGLLSSCLMPRRNRLPNVIALGTLGSAVGFFAGFTWKTRNVTSSVAQSTARELRKVRDQRWLELNPIDYA